MRIGRSEALDIFQKWISERAMLQCCFTFPDYTASFQGRIFRVSESEINLGSDDRTSELALRLREWMVFSYGDPRGVPDEAQEYESMLSICFGELPDEGQPDMIAFCEFKQFLA